MINPTCCTYAVLYVTLSFPWAGDDDMTSFTETKPLWVIRGAMFDKKRYGECLEIENEWYKNGRFSSIEELASISMCPKCGEKMPEIKLIDDLPDNIPVDQGGYCGTCEERSMACTCVDPYELWELV